MRCFTYFVFWAVFHFFSPLVSTSHAQVRIIQWSDVHSTVNNLSQQMMAIDEKGQEFLRKNPNGEVIIVVLGDFTSLNPYSMEDKGWLSLKALRTLKLRGYTVLFIPGNHDAFDWNHQVDGVELFISQVKKLHSWGIPTVVANLKSLTGLKGYVQKFYPLKTIKEPSHLVGATLVDLVKKSNQTPKTLRKAFTAVLGYPVFWKSILSQIHKIQGSKIYLAVHDSTTRVKRNIPLIKNHINQMNLSVDIPLIMTAHDHRVVATSSKGVLISDGGSHGSFNVIDITKEGEVHPTIQHVSRLRRSQSWIDESFFSKGISETRSTYTITKEKDPWIWNFHQEAMEKTQSVKEKLNRTLVTTMGIPEAKKDLKRGPKKLGSMITEALKLWAQSQPWFQPDLDIIAFSHSGSYRLEDPLPKGGLTEHTFRMMYPFLSEASAFLAKGHEIEDLFFKLRQDYTRAGKDLYTPQINFHIREKEEFLEIFKDNQWTPLKPDNTYVLVLDGWISDQNSDGKISQWVSLLEDRKALGQYSHQEIIVKYLPQVIKNFERDKRKKRGCRLLLKENF